jgi:hypothetical protein
MMIHVVNPPFCPTAPGTSPFVFIEGFSRRRTIGYYAMVGIFLKSFGVRPPDGSTPLK